MVRVKGPLFSVAATGIFNGLMEFHTGSGKTTVRRRRTANPIRSDAQQAQSLRFANAVIGWQGLSDSTKTAWKTSAQATPHNGYQLYISEYQTQNIQPPNQPVLP